MTTLLKLIQKKVALLTQLWPDGKPINKLKLDDIKTMMHLVPADTHGFYNNLTGMMDIMQHWILKLKMIKF